MEGVTGENVDKIICSLGVLGKYQVLHIVLGMVATLGSAFQLLSNVFIGRVAEHSCAAPGNVTEFLQQFQDGPTNLTLTLSKCSMQVMDNGTEIQALSCYYGNNFSQPIDKSFLSQFDLVCDRKNLGRLSQTLVIAGQGIGAVLATVASDYLGRKTVLVASNLGLLTFGVVIAFSPNFPLFCVAKVMVGGFQQGVVTSLTVFILELLPTKHRKLAAVFSGLQWAIGVMSLSLVAFIFKDFSWRILQTALSVVSLCGFVQWYVCDESLRWVLAKGDTKKAMMIIKRMARINGKPVDDTLLLANNALLPLVQSEISGEKHSACLQKTSLKTNMTFLDILKKPRLLMNALCLWCAWLTTATAFFVIYLTSTSLSGNPYLNFFLTALMEVPSNIFFFFAFDTLGRRTCVRILFGFLGGGLLCASVCKTLEATHPIFPVLTTVSTLMAMGGASGCFGLLYQFTPEMFPTNLRNQSLGVSSFIGRIGGMLAPFFGLLAEKAVWAPGLMMGLMAVLVCVLISFVPETTGRELPQTLAELKLWYKRGDKNGKSEKKESLYM